MIWAGGEQPRRELFEHGDARILAQLEGQLVGARIDAEDMRRAAREQHIGKSPGRGADIHGNRALGRKPEMIERMGQLDPAAADPGMIAPAHRDRRIRGQLLAGLVDPRLPGKHQPRHHQRLRPGAAFGQPALDQQLIDAALGRFCGRHTRLGHGQGRPLARKERQ